MQCDQQKKNTQSIKNEQNLNNERNALTNFMVNTGNVQFLLRHQDIALLICDKNTSAHLVNCLSIACAHRKEVICVLGLSIIVKIFEHFYRLNNQTFHHVLTHLYPVQSWYLINSASDIKNNGQRDDSPSQDLSKLHIYCWIVSVLSGFIRPTNSARLYRYSSKHMLFKDLEIRHS